MTPPTTLTSLTPEEQVAVLHIHYQHSGQVPCAISECAVEPCAIIHRLDALTRALVRAIDVVVPDGKETGK